MLIDQLQNQEDFTESEKTIANYLLSRTEGIGTNAEDQPVHREFPFLKNTDEGRSHYKNLVLLQDSQKSPENAAG